MADVSTPSLLEFKQDGTVSLAQAATKQCSTCQAAEANLRDWIKDKPIRKVPTMIEVHGKPRKVLRLTPYRRKPMIPAFCPAQPTTGT